MFDDNNRDDSERDEDYQERRPRRYRTPGERISARDILLIVVVCIFVFFVCPAMSRSGGSGNHDTSTDSGGWFSSSDYDSSDWDTGDWDASSDSWDSDWSSSDSDSWDSGWDSGSDSGSWDSGSDSFDSGSDSGSW